MPPRPPPYPAPRGRGCGHPQHDLADVPRLAHEAKRLAGPPHVPRADRQLFEHAALEQRDDLLQHLPHALGPGLDQVERAVGHPRVLRRDELGVADVGLAHLDEATPLGSSSSEASTSSRASEFRTTSTPRPPVACRNRSLNPASREEAV